MSYAQRRRISVRRGVSLVEISIVIMILGILTSVATPAYFHALARGRVDAASRKIVADLAMVRSTAEVASASRTLKFSTINNKYSAEEVADFDRATSDLQVRLGASPFYTSIVSVDLGGDDEIVFNGFGLPDSGGTIVVQSGNLQRTINVDAVTGEGVSQ